MGPVAATSDASIRRLRKATANSDEHAQATAFPLTHCLREKPWILCVVRSAFDLRGETVLDMLRSGTDTAPKQALVSDRLTGFSLNSGSTSLAAATTTQFGLEKPRLELDRLVTRPGRVDEPMCRAPMMKSNGLLSQ